MQKSTLNKLCHYDLWMLLLSKRHSQKYHLGLLVLATIMVIFPVDTAFLERVFALMNRLQSKSRNRLCPEMLNHLLVICLLGPNNGMAGINKLIPDIILKWRSNVKTARKVTSMFRETSQAKLLPLEFAEALYDFTKVSDDDFYKEVLSVLNENVKK